MTRKYMLGTFGVTPATGSKKPNKPGKEDAELTTENPAPKVAQKKKLSLKEGSRWERFIAQEAADAIAEIHEEKTTLPAADYVSDDEAYDEEAASAYTMR